MTEIEFRIEMKRLGWDEMEIEEMIRAHNSNIDEFGVAVPFEAMAEEKPRAEYGVLKSV